MPTPLVSVVLPTTGGPWLNEAISSVLAQTMTDLELIVIDCAEPPAVNYDDWDDPRVRTLRMPWPGVPTARNIGNDHARAPYIAVLDHDDRWLPHKLERQLALLEAAPGVAMCYTRFEIIDSSGSVVGLGSLHPVTAADVLDGRWPGICHSSTVWRRTVLLALGGYDPRAIRSRGSDVTDFDLILRTLAVADLQYEPSVQVQYRVHAQAISRNYRAQHADTMHALHRHLPALASAAGYSSLTSRQWSLAQRPIRSWYLDAAWTAAVSEVRAHHFSSALSHFLWYCDKDPKLATKRFLGYLARRAWPPKRLSTPVPPSGIP